MHILRCRGESAERLEIDGHDVALPEFCQIIRASPGGKTRCSVCRWLMAIRACHKGPTTYGCHGGIAVVAAPAMYPTQAGGEFVVVASCGLGTAQREQGWEAAKQHAEGLPIAEDALREAYFRLPVLAKENYSLARSIVDAAAAMVAQSLQAHAATGEAPSLGAGELDEEDFEAMMRHALAHSACGGQCEAVDGSGSVLVDIVTGIVSRNPAVPFTVHNVARAAQVSPNHFSTVFRRHMGETFTEFLGRKRIERAKEYLGDPRLTVYDVAEKCGFQDPAYFARRFKALTGATPSRWRKQTVG